MRSFGDLVLRFPGIIKPCKRALLSCALAACALGQTSGIDAVISALRQKNYREASEALGPLLERSPRNPQLWTLQAMVLSGMGKIEDCLESYDKAVALSPEYVPALQGAAQVAFQTGHPEAQVRLEKVLAIRPEDPTAHSMLGMLAFEKRACSEAIEHFERGRPALDSNSLVLRRYGHCLFVNRRPEKAADVFRQVLALVPDDDAVRYNLGLSLYEAQQHHEAVETLRPLLEREPPDPDVFSLIAEAEEATVDTPSALETLKKAVALFPLKERLYLQLAELCAQHGAYDLGLEVVEVGAKNIPASPRLQTMLGVLHAQLGRYDEAERSFREAAKLDPELDSAAIGLTVTLQKAGRLNESVEVLRQLRRESPDDGVASFLLAQALIRQGSNSEDSLDETREALEAAVRHLPEEADPRVELGKLYLRSRDVEAAIQQLKKAISIEPSNRTAVYQLMLALRQAGRQEEVSALAVQVRKQLAREKDDEVERNRYRLVKDN